MCDDMEELIQKRNKELLFDLVTKNKLSTQEAAEELNMSLPEFKQAYNEYLKSK